MNNHKHCIWHLAYKSNTTDETIGAGTDYPFGTPEFIPVFNGMKYQRHCIWHYLCKSKVTGFNIGTGTALLTLSEHLSSHPVFSQVRVTQSLVFCVVSRRSLFAFLSLCIDTIMINSERILVLTSRYSI